MKFEIGKEYKLIKRNGETAVKTFTVEKISHKNMKVLVKGGIHGVFDLRIDKNGDEMISLGMIQRNYLNPFATDIL